MSVESTATNAILDVEGTLARFGGDRELFVEMTTMLLEDAPSQFAALRGAVNDGNAAAVRMKAHALKGLLAGCGGARAAHSAQLLEDAGQSGNLSDAATLVEVLESELNLLQEAIRAYQP